MQFCVTRVILRDLAALVRKYSTRYTNNAFLTGCINSYFLYILFILLSVKLLSEMFSFLIFLFYFYFNERTCLYFLVYYFCKLFVLISYYNLVFTCSAFGFDYDLVSIFFLL
jgi:hypothetical protein